LETAYENSPPPVTFELADDTARLLSAYLTNRWKESSALFPSRSSDRISEQGVRNMLHKVAEAAAVRPYKIDGSRGDAGDVTPHALRHGVAYRMMNEEENTLYDVRNRLRHRSIQTTERIYDHLLKV
jgi:integrase/recombinase XerC/integrase/recombinase XerD